MKLSNKQKQFLKGLAHSIKPVVQLGANGLTEGVVAEIDSALNHHELIKVKVPTDDKEEKVLIMDAIIRETQSVKVQVIGHMLVIFRPTEERKIQLPKQ
ncbi:ribosome assembly RNA-binding protein YhbY [Alteromonas sp. 14N.309.X.WAT.G.H12]|uniref:ribosome assembly RNA-binding protein YhbY n=1 Tax=Alteromonas sp. 14N.309.X.WAT.G.H12 TaxID=3120824 RepID=UPI002FD28122